jgi:hypothetical protein
MSYPFLPVNPCCTDVVLNTPCGCSSTYTNTGCNNNDPCNTHLTVSSTIVYNGPTLPCIVAEPCDTLNVILQKMDEIICNLLTQVNYLNNQVNNITTQIIDINNNIININNILDDCCSATTTTTTTTAEPTTTTTTTEAEPTTTTTTTVACNCFDTEITISSEELASTDDNQITVLYKDCEGEEFVVKYEEAGIYPIGCVDFSEDITALGFIDDVPTLFNILITTGQPCCEVEPTTTTTTTIST